MSISFIQSINAFGTLTGAGQQLSATFLSNNNSGDIITVGIVSDTNVSFSITDTNNNVYNPLSVVPFTGGVTQIFYALNVSGGPNIVTCTVGGACSLWILNNEFSGATSFDTKSSNTGTGINQDSGNITSSIKDELLFGLTGGIRSGTVLSFFPGTGYTQIATNVTQIPVYITEYQIVSSLGTYSASSTSNLGKSATIAWATTIATFGIANRKTQILDFGIK